MRNTASSCPSDNMSAMALQFSLAPTVPTSPTPRIAHPKILKTGDLSSHHFCLAGLVVALCPQSRRGPRSRGTRCVAQRATADLKAELLSTLSGEDWDPSRVEAAQRVEDIVAELTRLYQDARLPPADAQKLLEGKWKLLSTFTPGQAAANFFSIQDWQKYIFGKGPSPVQAAAFTNNAVQRVYQVLDFSAKPGRWYNVIDATPAGIICLEADLSSTDADINFQWTGGKIVIKRPPWSQKDLDDPVRLPYPAIWLQKVARCFGCVCVCAVGTVGANLFKLLTCAHPTGHVTRQVPFALLGDRARGVFETVYLDEDLRSSAKGSDCARLRWLKPPPGISRGSKSGSVFVLCRESCLAAKTQWRASALKRWATSLRIAGAQEALCRWKTPTSLREPAASISPLAVACTKKKRGRFSIARAVCAWCPFATNSFCHSLMSM